jgi:hypothetical protein
MRLREERDRKRSATAAEPKTKQKKERPARAAAPRPSDLERLEADIERREAKLKDLEGSLATDWTNADLVAEHRRARDELDALMARWEGLAETRPG